MQPLDLILAESAKRHKHLCPRQVLGARMGLFAAELLGIEFPRKSDFCIPASGKSTPWLVKEAVYSHSLYRLQN